MKLIVALGGLLALHGTAVAADAAADATAPSETDAGAADALPAAAPPPQATDPEAPPRASAPPAAAKPAPRPVLPSDPAAVKEGAPAPDEWPVEYVLRPQTIPAGRLRATLSTSFTSIDSDFRAPGGVKYWSFYEAGGSVTFAVTDRFEFSTFVPRLLCVASGSPSACSDYARINGSGFGVGYGVVRTRAFQLMLVTSVDIALTQPMTFELGVGARMKVLVADRVAFELGLNALKWVDPPAFYQYESVGFASAEAELDVQATHNLVLWVGLAPNAPLDNLDEPRLAPLGGLSWTFENAMALGANGGIYNVLSHHAWDLGLPGWFAGLWFQFWI